jgi:hypothetical protein
MLGYESSGGNLLIVQEPFLKLQIGGHCMCTYVVT